MKIKKICSLVEEKTGARCTPAMVNNYERLGLLPEPQRTPGGTRVYSADYVDRIARIIELKGKYLRLDAVKEIVEREAALAPTRTQSLAKSEVSRKDDSRREQIVQAALQAFSTSGFQNTKISEIADMIGCGVGTIYVHFSGKKELLLAVVDFLIDAMLAQFGQIDEAESDPLERLKQKGVALLKNYGRIKDIIFVLQAETVGEDIEFTKKAEELFARHTGAIRKDLEDTMNAGLTRSFDAEALSYGILGMAQMMGYRSYQDEKYTPELIVDIIEDIMTNGIRMRA
jgi:AcrR family transcriptional regulator